MKILPIYPRFFASNCYLLISGSHAVAVDPGVPMQEIFSALTDHGANLERILLTHGHFDHIASMDALRDALSVPACIHESELGFPADSDKNAYSRCSRGVKTYRPADVGFSDGDEIKLGDESILVMHTPGHTQGSCCFLCNGEFLLTGDTVFAQGFGRTDLYSGSEAELAASLEKLKRLPGHLPIYPGHGEDSILSSALRNPLY